MSSNLARTILLVATLCLMNLGCSKKHDQASQPAGSASSAKPTGSAAADKPGSAAAETSSGATSPECDICRKADACCKAFDENEAKNPVSCTRAQTCEEPGGDAQMRKDIIDTCKDRLDEWRKDHPDLAACK